VKEIRIPHSDPALRDSKRITQLNKRILAREFDGDPEAIHRHEVHEVIDDFDRGERILKIRKRKFFT
jgi:hypothetical protein